MQKITLPEYRIKDYVKTIFINYALAVLKELIGGFHHVFGDNAAQLPGQGVGAAARVIAYAHEPSRLHLAVHRGLAGEIGIAVLMVKGGGAAMLYKVRKGGDGGVVYHLVVCHLEYAVYLVYPFRHSHGGIVYLAYASHKGLEKVMMGVHKAGVYKHTCGVDYLRPLGSLKVLPYGLYGGTFYQHVRVKIHPVLFVAGDYCLGVCSS